MNTDHPPQRKLEFTTPSVPKPGIPLGLQRQSEWRKIRVLGLPLVSECPMATPISIKPMDICRLDWRELPPLSQENAVVSISIDDRIVAELPVWLIARGLQLPKPIRVPAEQKAFVTVGSSASSPILHLALTVEEIVEARV